MRKTIMLDLKELFIPSSVYETKVRSFKKPVTRSSFFAKSVVIFAGFVLISAKMTTLLKEMRIA